MCIVDDLTALVQVAHPGDLVWNDEFLPHVDNIYWRYVLDLHAGMWRTTTDVMWVCGYRLQM